MKTKSLLAMLLLLSTLLVSCASDGATDANDTSVGENAEPTVAETSEPTSADIITERFTDTDYEGYTFRVMSSNPGTDFYAKGSAIENEIYFEEETGNGLYDAIYKRNVLTEELLNISIEPVYMGKHTETRDKLRNAVLANEDSCDLVLNRFDYQLNLAAEKLMFNLLDIDTLDTTSPWWNQGMVENLTLFGNALYALMGDYNFYDNYCVSSIYFNKRIMDDFGFEYPYQDVRDGTWTFEKMYDMALAATTDLNGDGELTLTDDLWGLGISHGGILNLIPNFGVSVAELNSDGEIEITYNEKMIDTVDYLYTKLVNNDKIFIDTSSYGKVFRDSRKMFVVENLAMLGQCREMTDDFGVVPSPKGDESMTEYRADRSNGVATALAIPITASDISRSGVVLDTLGAFSTDTVDTEFYNVLLTEKLIRDEDSKEMVKIISDSGVFSWGRDFKWADKISNIFLSLHTNTSNTYVSQMESILPQVQIQLDEFMNSYR